MRDLFSCKFKRDKIFFNTTGAVQSVSSCTACVIKTRTNDMSDIYYFYLKIAVLLIVLGFFFLVEFSGMQTDIPQHGYFWSCLAEAQGREAELTSEGHAALVRQGL